MSMRLSLLILLLLFSFWLAVASMVDDSITMDEQNHVARGLALLRTGDPRLSVEHPPLINAFSALPLLAVDDIMLPLDDPSWQRQPPLFFWYDFAANLFWRDNPQLLNKMVVPARVPIVLVTMLLGCIGYAFAAELWHPVAGTLALTLLLTDPNILAHGRYSTTDVGGATALLLAVWLLWRLWSRPVLWRLLWASLALGLAFGSKLSTLGFVPILAVVALLPQPGQRWRARTVGERLIYYAVAGVGALFVVWALYLFEWGAYQFIGDLLLPLNRLSGPLPSFMAGVERIFMATSQGRQAYLLGQFRDGGFLLYFPVAFLTKSPLSLLLLLLLLPLLARRRRRALLLLTPALLYFLLTLRSGLNIGYRHLLPMVPLLYVGLSGIAPAQLRQAGRVSRRGYLTLVVAALAVTTAVAAFPHYIGYFNPIVGRDSGWKVLADSNIDWGQDLIRLQRWMEQQQIDEVYLSYFGSADPARYLNYRPLPGEPRHRDLWWNLPFDRDAPQPGVYAISVHNLLEMPLQLDEKTVYSWFRARPPDARVGSFVIYRVGP